MTTALDIVNAALKKAGIVGVGQTAAAEDANDAFSDMNDMLAQWQRKRWLVWHLVDVPLVSTGAQSYTVGAGGDFNIARPDRLEAAFFRQITQSQPNQIDYPLAILQSREDYNRIAIKELGSFSRYIFYDSAYPLGSVYPWPVPAANLYEIHLTLKEQLSQFANLNSAVNMPPEYVAALKWNLAIRVHAGYPGLPPIPETVALALDSLNLIRGANAQVPRLVMPVNLVRPGIYDIYSDRTY